MMGPNESQRLALMHRLGEVLGEQEAATLMDSLPPYDWHEVATKTDLTAMEARLTTLIESRTAQMTRTLVLTIVGFAVTVWISVLVPVLVT